MNQKAIFIGTAALAVVVAVLLFVFFYQSTPTPSVGTTIAGTSRSSGVTPSSPAPGTVYSPQKSPIPFIINSGVTGSVSVPGTTGTTGSVSIPGTSGAVSIPGTSGPTGTHVGKIYTTPSLGIMGMRFTDTKIQIINVNTGLMFFETAYVDYTYNPETRQFIVDGQIFTFTSYPTSFTIENDVWTQHTSGPIKIPPISIQLNGQSYVTTDKSIVFMNSRFTMYSPTIEEYGKYIYITPMRVLLIYDGNIGMDGMDIIDSNSLKLRGQTFTRNTGKIITVGEIKGKTLKTINSTITVPQDVISRFNLIFSPTLTYIESTGKMFILRYYADIDSFVNMQGDVYKMFSHPLSSGTSGTTPTPIGTSGTTPAPIGTSGTTPAPIGTSGAINIFSGTPSTSGAIVSSKKGFVVGHNDPSGAGKVLALKTSWYYTWGPTGIAGLDLPFFPMFWNVAKSVPACTLTSCPVLTGLPGDTLLAYNEPDGQNAQAQANMTVGQAVEFWPLLVATGKRLGSPVMYGSLVNSTTNPLNTPAGPDTAQVTINGNIVTLKPSGVWLDNFLYQLSQTSNPKYPDFICIHWYGPPIVSSFTNYLEEVYDKYKLPLWITEYSCADWKATCCTEVAPYSRLQYTNITQGTTHTAGYDWSYPTQDNITTNATAVFMVETVQYMNSKSFVERFSWKERFLLAPPGTSGDSVESPSNPDVMGQSALFASFQHFPATVPQLTPLGELYASL